MIVALNIIATQKAKNTQETANKVVKLMNYAATHPEAITRYHYNGMMTEYKDSLWNKSSV